MMRPISFVFVAVACSVQALRGDAQTVRALSSDAQAEQIHKLAIENSLALISGNYARLVDLTYPKLVEMIGGRDKMIEMLRSGNEDMKAHGSAILGAEVSEPKEIVVAGDKQFAIVPMVVRMHVPEGTLRSNGYLIALSEDHGNTWKFIDGAGLHKGAVTERETLAQIVPGFPAQLSLPAWKPPVLEPK
jgi:hypothetical protein